MQAMKDEMESLNINKTWSEICLVPNGRQCVGTKWVFKIKRDENGAIIRYKARLVALGYLQKEGRDFTETFSPVLQTSLLRMLFAHGAKRDLEIEQIDFKTAFLNGGIDCEIYVRLPDGSTRRLQKGIYGLKQAGRLRSIKLHKSLIALNFKRCQSDPCCYIMQNSSTLLILIVHVDDCIIFGSDKAQIATLKVNL